MPTTADLRRRLFSRRSLSSKATSFSVLNEAQSPGQFEIDKSSWPRISSLYHYSIIIVSFHDLIWIPSVPTIRKYQRQELVRSSCRNIAGQTMHTLQVWDEK